MRRAAGSRMGRGGETCNEDGQRRESVRRFEGKPYLSNDPPHHAPYGLALGPQLAIDILQVLQRFAQLWQIKNRGKAGDKIRQGQVGQLCLLAHTRTDID